MAITSLKSRNWIYALFIRDDNERFVLGIDNYEFKDGQQHFAPNEIVNDTVELQGTDGVLLAGQVERAKPQDFDGYVGGFTTSKNATENLRQQFFRFFAKNHKFTVIYILSGQQAVKRQRGYLVDAPSVKEIDQRMPEYHVALGFEDVNYYSYDESNDGQEIFANSVDIIRTDEILGGALWERNGLAFDGIGVIFDDGSGGDLVVTVTGISGVSPVITIAGECVNPAIENPATGEVMRWNGTIAAGQKLVIDCNEQTVKMSGLSQLDKFEGDWIRLREGSNRIIFTSDGGDNKVCNMAWNEVVG